VSEAKRYFTRAEVERLIPRLARLMEGVRDANAEAGALRRALQEAQRHVLLVGGVRLVQEDWRTRKARLERAATAAQRGLAGILALGGVPKDLELGLVDFPAWLEGREVNLCWRLGEQRVGFWHAVDEGFAGRKPWPAEGERGAGDR
jgi:hypothetical protein